jgi:hypothetical protein
MDEAAIRTAVMKTVFQRPRSPRYRQTRRSTNPMVTGAQEERLTGQPATPVPFGPEPPSWMVSDSSLSPLEVKTYPSLQRQSNFDFTRRGPAPSRLDTDPIGSSGGAEIAPVISRKEVSFSLDHTRSSLLPRSSRATAWDGCRGVISKQPVVRNFCRM